MFMLISREALLVLLCGVFAHFLAAQWHGPVTGLFWVGMFMGMTFMALYAIVVLSSSRMRTPIRAYLGVAAFGAAFLLDLVQGRPGMSTLAISIPTAMAALLAGLGAITARFSTRLEAATDGFFAYSLGMAGIRWLLLPLLGASSDGQALAFFTGAFYMTLRVAFRLVWPSAPEGDLEAGPLVHRPVPDLIVGLVEGASNYRARPYATHPDGTQNRSAISLLCPPDEVDRLIAQLAGRLAPHFTIFAGVEVEGQIEVVIQSVSSVAPSERS